MMSKIWILMAAAAILCALATGRAEKLTGALSDGAGAAVSLTISLAGMICLWTGVMEVMRRAGLSEKLSKLSAPLLGRLFPGADSATRDALSANVSANLLGLGNAATPMGLIAAQGLQRGHGKAATDSFALLVVINTASLQLIPVTIASVRASNGAAAPFDILPHVWLTSCASAVVAVIAARLFARVWK
ncbi:spore maturation protein A [Clostridia bacterium]|nr:spore maturation protein A [Clostridia bacterium]